MSIRDHTKLKANVICNLDDAELVEFLKKYRNSDMDENAIMVYHIFKATSYYKGLLNHVMNPIRTKMGGFEVVEKGVNRESISQGKFNTFQALHIISDNCKTFLLR